MEIRLPKPLAVLLAVPLIICLAVLAAFCLLFGVANLLHPDVPADFMAAHPWQNTLACMAVMAIGLFFAGLALIMIHRTFIQKWV